jgi:alpha-ribazole phosphatase/probable phosphoglycerate mutase
LPVNSPIQTQVDLLRHGEPVGGRRYRGQIDDPLSAKGWQQMRAAVRDMRGWDVIYSSPLRRCAEFAQELSGLLSLPVKTDERLKEIGFGCWEGRTPDDIRQDDPQRLENFWRDPIKNRPEGAETLASFQARVSAAWTGICATHPGQRVLIVGHAGITRMILSLVLGSPVEHMFRIQVDNAGLSRIRIQGDGKDALPILVFHGLPPAASQVTRAPA